MIRSTTVICVRHKGKVAMAADGQVTLGQTVLKKTAQKIRRLHKGDVLAGFAGATSDAFALFARFEIKLEEYRGNLSRAAIELAKDWRLEKSLRQLDALLVVADKETTFLISGTGDVVEPDDGIIAIGSGGPFALAAARALGFIKDERAVEPLYHALGDRTRMVRNYIAWALGEIGDERAVTALQKAYKHALMDGDLSGQFAINAALEEIESSRYRKYRE